MTTVTCASPHAQPMASHRTFGVSGTGTHLLECRTARFDR